MRRSCLQEGGVQASARAWGARVRGGVLPTGLGLRPRAFHAGHAGVKLHVFSSHNKAVNS